MLYPGTSAHIPLTTFAEITRDLAKKSSRPVCLHLDHCGDYDFLLAAMEAGFDSVLADASRLPFAENAAFVKRVVQAAKNYGASVEAELGYVGSAGILSDYADESKYTEPSDVESFARETGASCVAVAIGNAHGNYVEAPKLDIKRLTILSEAAGVPLVLHGGSGIPDDQLEEAVKNGISKTNFGTDLFNASYAAMTRYSGSGGTRLMEMLQAGVDGGASFAEGRIRLCAGDF